MYIFQKLQRGNRVNHRLKRTLGLLPVLALVLILGAAPASARSAVRAAAAGRSDLPVNLPDKDPGNPPVTVLHSPAQCPNDPYEPNDNIDLAAAISTNTSYDLPLCPQGDEDWFAVHLLAGETIYISLFNLPADYDLFLYSAASYPNPLATSTNGGTTSEFIEYTVSTTADYYIQVHGYDNAWSESTYTFGTETSSVPATDTPTPTPIPTATPTPEPCPDPYDWQPAIPSGVYTFTVAANDGHNMPVISQVVFNYEDTTPPAAPQGVTSHVNADGVAMVSWHPAASDPDVTGYRISTSAGETFTVTHPISQAIVTTLDPAASIQADVAAIDMSGNVGPGTSVGMRAPDLQVIAMQPADGSTDDAGAEVTVAFNQPVIVQNFRVLDEDGLEVPGEAEGLSYDLGAVIPIAEPVWGVRFIPATGWLAAGEYTAEVEVATDVVGGLRVLAAGLSTGIAPAGTTSSYQWTFTISGEPARIWMPLVAQ